MLPLEKLEGETWNFIEEVKRIEYTNMEQSTMDITMLWIIKHLENLAIHILIDTKKEEVATLEYVAKTIKNCIIALKEVGFYPEKAFNNLCVESSEIFERKLTAYEMYKVIFYLYWHTVRFHKLQYGYDDINDATREYRRHMIVLYNKPEVFKYS